MEDSGGLEESEAVGLGGLHHLLADASMEAYGELAEYPETTDQTPAQT